MGSRQLEARLKRLADRSEGVAERAYARRLGELERHLRAARGQPSPAMALHKANARAVAFQLQALARAHRATVDDKAFLRLHSAFKAVEDGLGGVDFQDAMVKRLDAGAAGASDPELRAYFVGRRAEACAQLERHLAIAGWWAEPEGEVSDAMDGVLDVLEDARWPGPRKERRAMAEYFAETAAKLQTQLGDGTFDFSELEAGVHELRRKVRWLSILPAAMDGLFVRREDKPLDPALAAYATESVVSSPYNRFAPSRDVPEPIELEPSAFLALSWLIAEMGRLKDQGQTGDALLAAARDLGDAPRAATARVRKALGDALVSHGEIAHAVREITDRFARDKVLVRLADVARGE